MKIDQRSGHLGYPNVRNDENISVKGSFPLHPFFLDGLVIKKHRIREKIRKRRFTSIY